MKVTVGMPTFDDADSVFFTVQSLLLHHDVDEVIVIDTNSESKHGQLVKKFAANRAKVKYVVSGWKSPAAKTLVFKEASHEIVICIDSHVLLSLEAVSSLREYLDKNKECKNLIQGPMLFDNLITAHTHMEPVWRGGMFGIWASLEGWESKEPFEIKMQGTGLLACLKSSWLGYNEFFRGFGGEEGYIHEKYRSAGACTMLLPTLKWSHKFMRPHGTPYKIKTLDRIWNYFVGRAELEKDTSDVYEHFEKQFEFNQLFQLENEARKVVRNHPKRGSL